MNKIRTILVDDERECLEKIEQLLLTDDQIEISSTCSSEKDAIRDIDRHLPDLVLMDIDNPDMDGFEIMQETPGNGHTPAFIFITSQPDYAAEAFNLGVVDYLVKPFDEDRLLQAINKAKKFINGYNTNGNRSHNVKKVYLKKILVKDSERLIFIPTREVDWFESSGNYIKVVMGEKNHFIRTNLKKLEDKLDPRDFIRIHNSTILNVNRIKEIKRWFTGDYNIKLQNGRQLRMSRTYRDSLKPFKVD